QLGLAETLASVIPDHRNPLCITHSLADILRARIFAIACGYPDADDLDHLRRDPAFKLACGRLPESGDDLASQPTISRREDAPDLCTLLRLGYAMVDLWCRSYRRPPTTCNSSSAWPATPCWPPRSRPLPMRCARNVRSTTSMWCAATPRPAMPPNPGPRRAASPPASRRPGAASISAMSSPTSQAAPP